MSVVQEMLQAGIPPEQVIPMLQQQGAPPEILQMVEEVLNQLMGGGQGAPPPDAGMGGPPPQEMGPPPAPAVPPPAQEPLPAEPAVDPMANGKAKGGGKAEMGERMAVMEHLMGDVRTQLTELNSLLKNLVGQPPGGMAPKMAEDLSSEDRQVVQALLGLLSRN